ncbi:MAG: hypothetical protein ACO1NU_08615 [Arcticibacter sp.]
MGLFSNNREKVSKVKKEMIASIEKLKKDRQEARTILEDLETYGFTCEAGELKDCIPFRRLKKLI